MSQALMVRQVGDPALTKKCKPIDPNQLTQSDLEDIENLKTTLNLTGGFGIAASQVGIDKRIIVIQVEKEKCSYQNCEDVPTTVMINPIWKKKSEKTNIEYEGCLSVPNIRGKVERYKEIELTYYNERGERMVRDIEGFFARDVQHECDHLDGIVFLDKVVSPGGFATKEMIQKYHLKDQI